MSHIKGVENIHCVLDEPSPARVFYEELFGPPAHVDGDWSELKIAGFDFAVTSGNGQKFVITFKVQNLHGLRAKLEQKLSGGVEIQQGEYGDFVEVCPKDGFCIHFFEAKKKY